MADITLNTNVAVQEMIKNIKILPRNKEKYPEVSDDDQIDAGSFIYALQTLGAGGDGNLTSLIWNLWINITDCVQSGGLTEDLQTAVQRLNAYLTDIGMFK